MANYNIAKAGEKTRFSSTRQPANAGRKPKLYTIAKKGYNIGYDEFKEVVVYLMQLPKAELEEIISRPDSPIWVVNIARAMHKDTGKGVTFTLREILDRLWDKNGKNAAEGADLDLSQLSEKELTQYYLLRTKSAKKKDE